jgi:hypothetical protein
MAKPRAMILLLLGLVIMSIALANLEIVGPALSTISDGGTFFVLCFIQTSNCRFYSAIGVNFLILGVGRYI